MSCDGGSLATQRHARLGERQLTLRLEQRPLGSRNFFRTRRAIRMALGHHADDVPASSPKSMVGHLIGAAGALGLALPGSALIPAPLTRHLRFARAAGKQIAYDLAYAGNLIAIVPGSQLGIKVHAPAFRALVNAGSWA